MRRVLLTCAFLLASIPIFAQTGIPTSYTLRIYAAGSATATTLTVPVSQIQCNLAPATGSNLNPTKWRWTDPANTGRECEYADAARLTALADGNYEGTASASNADGTSAEGARVPFVRRRPTPPGVPTGLSLIP